MALEVRIDEQAGYCFGVVKAIGAAEEVLAQEGSLYCLGDIVHNSAEVERLESRGLRVIGHDMLPQLAGSKVLIRAHGEPPETYRTAEALGIRLVDATCPIVLALQQRIRKGYDEMARCGGQIVIFGKPGHAEVVGLTGQTGGTAVVVSRPDDIASLDFSRPIRLYSQTTKSREEYRQLIDNIEARLPEGADFVAYDTVCNRVAGRAKELERFAGSVDVLLFVAGSNSSNGHYLYEYCRKVQPRTHLIASAAELEEAWFEGAGSVGISGATSTPRWLMEEVAAAIQQKPVS
ncbi:MAG: 4-hydroxy-3-methylbut-2-enyl diphosphate reductase [Bacteroidales bacterium]|nr:4-hydroxy-3-methylbut-2-enyl diphosphate reductase [Bacteroidales bacterium]